MKSPLDYRRGKARQHEVATVAPHYFTIETFQRIAADLKSKRNPLPRVTMTHESLQVIMRDTGLISYHAIYNSDKTRTSMTLGHHPDMTLSRARKIAESIQKIADRGIDPQEGLRVRLIKEIEQQGEKWKP